MNTTKIDNPRKIGNKQSKLRREGEDLVRKYLLMKQELENKNKTISYLIAEKMSLETKINRMKQPHYK